MRKIEWPIVVVSVMLAFWLWWYVNVQLGT